MRIPKNISLTEDGQYCLECFKKEVKRIFRNGHTYYQCNACGEILERSLVLDNKIVWWVDEVTQEYWHESVGIFIFNDKNQALFFERIIYPFALTIPSGHLDTGEDHQTAILREIFEETGIKIGPNNVKLFIQEDIIGDKCRRGADNHKWSLYTAKLKKGGHLQINDEGTKPVWLSLEEAVKENLVYPTRYFIKKYGKKLLTYL